jgi:hypothetical protein
MTNKPYGWSPRLRHGDMQVYGNIARRDGDTTRRRIAGILADRRLFENGEKEVSWGLKVKQLKWGLLAGISLESMVVKEGFGDYNWRSIGHGNYLVGSRGFFYSHSDKVMNGKPGQREIKTGDSLSFKCSI